MKNNILHSPLIIDVAGYELTEQDKIRLQDPLVGGVIHFSRNWQDRRQLTTLNQQIKQIRADLLIAVDHEGGRVQRFKTDGFTHLPAMAKLGLLYQQQPNIAQQLAVATGYVLASELRACGVDFSFTPVLDLAYGNSQVIGDRAFSDNPQIVATLAQSLNYGLLLAGMGNCGKHFPGHGYVVADSHLDIPIDQRSFEQIYNQDILPYTLLNPGLTSLMPAHVVYCQIDSKPAGFSQIWLQQILRNKLNYDGAIFSDDLSMQGASQVDGVKLTFAQAGSMALNAGCDLLLLCNQSVKPGVLDDFIAQMHQALQQQQWQLSTDSERRRKQLLPTGLALDWQQLQQQLQYQYCKQLLRQHFGE